jgi:hypothetical protein
MRCCFVWRWWWWWQCWDGDHFIPMTDTILYSGQASVISGNEQLQLTVFTARYLLGQAKASAIQSHKSD